ncbi:hypothetical protein GNI_181450 [Gregarina niphandrodes]|uniref:Uncharacterized protein n=1 Tax=Gregarina niphandrodes TaxID=110365 RepID=A0A023AXL1_GRENI|nr:hypothetical protein GNI_181450 [Gregarina niphandrodes]EZG43228.1 hypothetical protein GNI_181450 [Gregarina niphandrodes]|eukprot:XP_011133515.1 hypothetical protein GNI_181450 [Gregarina niphandrodes]
MGICKYPYLWNDRAPTVLGDGVIFLLKDARDQSYKVPLSLFPMFLRPELHGVRAVIEAFSDEGALVRSDHEAAGVGFVKETGTCTALDLTVTVALGKAGTAKTNYTLDRWE